MIERNKIGGKEMKNKKILTFFLAMLMLITSLPLQVFAAPEKLFRVDDDIIFPDRNLRLIVKEFDTNKDDYIDENELLSAREMTEDMYKRSRNVRNWRGFRRFRNLTHIKAFKAPLIENFIQPSYFPEAKVYEVGGLVEEAELELRPNQRLQKLIIRNAPLIEDLDLGRDNGVVGGLELYSLPKLKSLDLDRFRFIKSLKVQDNKALTEITSSNKNDINRTNVSLTEVECTNNPALTKIDLSGFPELKTVRCHDNALNDLNVDNCSALEALNCNNNNLTNLDVRKVSNLKYLSCNTNRLSNLDTTKCTKLQILDCSKNQLTKLDARNSADIFLLCNNNQLTNDNLLFDVNSIIKLDCSHNQLTSAEKLSKMGRCVNLDFSYNDVNYISVDNMPELYELRCNNNKNLFGIENMGWAKSLRKVYCNDCSISNIEIIDKYNVQLFELYCQNNNIGKIVMDTGKLEKIDCSNNWLLSLNIDEDAPINYFKADNQKRVVKRGKNETQYEFDPTIIWLTKISDLKNATIRPTPFAACFQYNPQDMIDGDINYNYTAQEKGNLTLRPHLAFYSDSFLDEIVGPKDPTKADGKNPDTKKYWTVTFASADTTKGTVAAENTVYVLKNAGKTLADIADKAPAATALGNNKFDGWDPALDRNTVIDGDITVKAQFSEKVFDPAHVEKMVVKEQPTKLVYTEGEKLALAGLEVTLTDNQGLTKDVAFADFADNGITAAPANDTELKVADSGKKVTLTKGNLTAETEALTVNEKVFDPAHVEKMVVKEQPTKLVYTEGEKLELAGLVVTLTDKQGLTKDVEFKDFAANGITAAPANDTALTVDDHNGTKVTLTKESLTAETEALTVKAKVFDPAHVEKMVVKTQPKLSYTEGEKLELAGLVVTLTDNQGLTKDVAFADFAANGITTNPTDGTELKLVDNGKPVALTKGNLQDETANLTVNAKVTPQDPIVGPVDPSVTPNPDEAKNWTVTFAADATKGTIDAKNTFYVPKTAGKTLADLANDAPEVTAKAGFRFTGWNPALDAKTSINGNLTVNATFETTTTPQDPIVGPVDPSVTPNPDEAKNWTVTFAADQTKGTIDAKNTFYVPKTAGKTLADLANDAPEVTAKAGFKFTGWNPALDAKTSINGNMTINAEFETTTTIPKVVVPDPVNPGTVPTGRVRVTFDAGEGNTIDGTTNRYKYLDVLENTAWTDEEVTKQIPSGAKYKDNTKTFDKWDKQVPTEGNVTEETFMAIYTGKSFDLYVDTLSVGETGITVRTSIPKVKITIIKGGKVLKEAYTNDLGLSTIILDDYTKTDENYQIKGEKEGYISKKVSIKVLSI